MLAFKEEGALVARVEDQPNLVAVASDPVAAAHTAILMKLLEPWAGEDELRRIVGLLVLNFRTPALALCSSEARLVSIGLSQPIAAYIASLKSIFQQALLAEMADRPQFPDFAAVLLFLQSLIGFNHEESFLVLYLDKDLRLINYEAFQSGNSQGVSIQGKAIVRGCLERDAQAVILAHNHPSGNPAPSWPDRVFTRDLQQQLALFDISLIDHIIVSQGKHQSLLHK